MKNKRESRWHLFGHAAIRVFRNDAGAQGDAALRVIMNDD
jgi:hypothetical protein